MRDQRLDKVVQDWPLTQTLRLRHAEHTLDEPVDTSVDKTDARVRVAGPWLRQGFPGVANPFPQS